MQSLDVRQTPAPSGTAIPSAERIHASAVAFLLEGDDQLAAATLLACTVSARAIAREWLEDDVLVGLRIELAGPRDVCEVLSDAHHPITMAIHTAVQAVLPSHLVIDEVSVRARLVDVDPGWRRRLLNAARGEGVDNQAGGNGAAHVWNGLRFRSRSEVAIAEALDRAGVLFLPNCRARLGAPPQRENREADFLVCHHGRWGILEVDGEPFHPASRAAEDHARDRVFRLEGISVVEHFDAEECRHSPDDVVHRFLEILTHTNQ
jgi:hypothetical protein